MVHSFVEQAGPMTKRFRIGIDLGGSKIEGAAIDALGMVRLRRRIPTPAGDYRATIAAIVSRRRGHRAADRHRAAAAPGIGRDRHAGRDFAGDGPGQERELHLAERPPAAARSRSGARPAGAPCQRRQLLCPLRSDRRCRGGLSDRVRRDPRNRRRRRDRRRRAAPRRRQCDRRRVGAQPAALAAARRTARSRLLLRPVGVHRDFSVGPGHGRRSSPPYRRRS